MPSGTASTYAGALLEPTSSTIETDIVIVGSGLGGSTAAWTLRDSGLRILVVERGDFMPEEVERGSAEAVYLAKRYVNAEPWYDGSNGRPFAPGVYYSVVLSAGSVNSAVLLLKSTSGAHPAGLANGSGLVGRNDMVHNSTFFMGVNPFRRNRTSWQETLGLNDWYLAARGHEFPLGNVQMLGTLRGAMFKGVRPWAPMLLLDAITDPSVDLYLTTEDLPDPNDRVRLESGRIIIDWKPSNLAPHRALVREVSRAVRKAGYPIILTERMRIETNSHQCGTAVAGTDPAKSVVDRDCRAHEVENLWVIDGSFFPSSAALNPALTIAANALRVAPGIADATRRVAAHRNAS